MNCGIISDIHNNVIALNAMLDLFQQKGVDKIICCGDIISIGPYPEQTVQRLMGLENLICCKGNHEKYLVNLKNNEPIDSKLSDDEVLLLKWEYNLLSEKSKDYIYNLPNDLSVNLNGWNIYLSHYGVDNNGKFIDVVYNPDILDCKNVFKNIVADIVLYGHSHEKYINKGIKTLYVNPGSLGCPSQDRNIARAVLLTLDDECSYKEISIEYNAETVVSEIDKLHYPACEEIKRTFYGF